MDERRGADATGASKAVLELAGDAVVLGPAAQHAVLAPPVELGAGAQDEAAADAVLKAAAAAAAAVVVVVEERAAEPQILVDLEVEPAEVAVLSAAPASRSRKSRPASAKCRRESLSVS